jgi:hypothetical protein
MDDILAVCLGWAVFFLGVLATEARDTIKVIEYALQSQKEQRVIAFS